MLRQHNTDLDAAYTSLKQQHSCHMFSLTVLLSCSHIAPAAKQCTAKCQTCSPVAHLHVLQLPQEGLPVLLWQVCM
jgi:hypothetical protein